MNQKCLYHQNNPTRKTYTKSHRFISSGWHECCVHTKRVDAGVLLYCFHCLSLRVLNIIADLKLKNYKFNTNEQDNQINSTFKWNKTIMLNRPETRLWNNSSAVRHLLKFLMSFHTLCGSSWCLWWNINYVYLNECKDSEVNK